MAANTKIEWTDHTFNPWVGCTKLTPACDHCYAEGWAKRTGNAGLWSGERRRTTVAYWRQPLKWDEAAKAAGKRARVFCCSLADVFDNQVPPEWRTDLLALIRATPWLEWQLLTKRPQNILKMIKPGDLPDNVALGATCEDQERADQRIPHLIRAARRLGALYTFLSCEPLLGPLSLRWAKWDNWKDANGHERETVDHLDGARMIGWVIVGGESGPGARPMNPEWPRKLRDECAEAGVPFFFKQHGEWAPAPENIDAGGSSFHRFDNGAWCQRVGKKRAGRLLDDKEHNEFPKTAAKSQAA